MKDDDLEDALRDVPTATKTVDDQWGRERAARLAPVKYNEVVHELEANAQAAELGAPLFDKSQPPPALPPPPPLPAAPDRRKLYGVLAGASVVLVLGLAIALSDSAPDAPPPPVRDGVLTVGSMPPGAIILLAGKDTGTRTPGELTGLPVGEPIAVAVRMPGFIVAPVSREVTLPEIARRASIDFVLTPARTIRVVSEPPGAEVAMDGVAIAGRTPLDLPPLELGRKVEIVVSGPDRMPAKVAIVSATDTATVTTVRLRPARTIDVMSEPPGAKIKVDDVEVGVTPQAVRVATDAPVVVRVDRAGFKTVWRKITPKMTADRLELVLEPLPLNKLPLSKDERERLGALERQLASAQSGLAATRALLKKGELDLERLRGERHSFVSDTSKIETQVERNRTKVDELEARLDELEGDMETMRAEILSRFAL